MCDTNTTFSCPKCGSGDIEEQVVVWVDPNKGEVTDGEWSVVPWDDRYCCDNCGHWFNEPTIEETRIITAEERFVVGVAGLGDLIPAKDAAQWLLEQSHDTLRRLIEAARELHNAKEADNASA